MSWEMAVNYASSNGSQTFTDNGSSYTGCSTAVAAASQTASTVTIENDNVLQCTTNVFDLTTITGTLAGGTYYVTDCVLNGDLSDSLAASISNQGTLIVSGTTIENTNNPNGGWPAVIVTAGTFDISGSTLTNNDNAETSYAPYEGWTMILNCAVNFSNDTIDNNGGIKITLGAEQSVDVDHTTLIDTTTTQDALNVTGTSSPDSSTVTISNSTLTEEVGGYAFSSHGFIQDVNMSANNKVTGLIFDGSNGTFEGP